MEDLNADLSVLEELLKSVSPIKNESDLKLIQLKQIIDKKLRIH